VTPGRLVTLPLRWLRFHTLGIELVAAVLASATRPLAWAFQPDNHLVMKAAPPPVADDELSRVLAALADPTRRSILEQLSIGPASVKDLAAPYDMSQPAVSKHLKVLEAAGLVSQEPGRLGRRRMELAPFAKATGWLEAYSRIWAARLAAFGPRAVKGKTRRSTS